MLSPMVKATFQATILSGISNLLAQLFTAYRSSQPFSLNTLELLRFLVLTLITSPPNYRWQQLLERVFPAHPEDSKATLPTSQRDLDEKSRKKDDETHRNESGKSRLNIRNTLTKWVIDCLTVGTLVNTTLFLVLMGVMKGQNVEQIKMTVKTKTVPLILAGYKLWPLVSIISFSFVPVEKRLVFFSCIGLFWGIYMSLVAARV